MGLTRGQVAGPRAAVFYFARCRQSRALLNALVCFLFGHSAPRPVTVVTNVTKLENLEIYLIRAVDERPRIGRFRGNFRAIAIHSKGSIAFDLGMYLQREFAGLGQLTNSEVAKLDW